MQESFIRHESDCEEMQETKKIMHIRKNSIMKEKIVNSCIFRNRNIFLRGKYLFAFRKQEITEAY